MSQPPGRIERLKAEITALQALLKLIEPWEQTPGESVSDIINRMTDEVQNGTAELRALTELQNLELQAIKTQAWPPMPGRH